jgi:hypothetical protein
MAIASVVGRGLCILPSRHGSGVSEGRRLKEKMASLEREEEWVKSRQILTPSGQTVAGNDQGLFELTVELGCQLGVDELSKWLDIELDLILVLR